MTETMTGAQWLAGSIAASGQTHVFFVDAVLRRTLLALGDAGVAPVLAHTEKAAVYMADGYARISGRPGIGRRNPWVRQTSRPGCRMLICRAHPLLR